MRSVLIPSLLIAGIAAPTAALAQQTAADPWTALTVQDVDAYCRDIRGIHPGMVDPYAPGFAERVEQACSTAVEQAEDADSYYDWRDTMAELVGGFRDGHTNISFVLTPLTRRWPGFLIYGQGGRWVVRRPDHSNVAAPGDPPEGAVLLGCDGQEAEEFLRERLDPALADWTKLPERIRLAYRAFVAMPDGGPPPVRTCRFELDGEVTETALDWRSISYRDLVSFIPEYSRRGMRSAIDAEFANDGHAWIRLANVSNEAALKALEADLIANQARLRAAPYIVFDLRGNAGGNSTWGVRFASILWGEEAVEARRLASESTEPGEYGKFWRGSKRASDVVLEEAAEYATRGPDWVPFADYWRERGEELGAQEEDGLVQDECCQPQPAPTDMPTPHYDGRVFVLTDAAAYSSGVIVMNALKFMGAIHVGEVSGHNEVWGESVGPLTLPSGLGTYRIPVSVIRQPRSSLGGLPPDIAWQGAMDDEEEIRAWIAGLAEQPDLGAERAGSD